MAKPDCPGEKPVREDMPDAAERGFYRRWSQCKSKSLRSGATENGEDVQPQPAGESAQVAAMSEGVPEAKPLPPVESLTEKSDLSEFMTSRVAEELRLLALRKVFHTPLFNLCDGLDDYAENYRNFEPLGDIITADLRYQLERMKQMAAKDADADVDSAAVPQESNLSASQVPPTEDGGDDDDRTDQAIESQDAPRDQVAYRPDPE